MIGKSRKVMFTIERIYSKIHKAAVQPSWFGTTTNSQMEGKNKNGKE